VDHQQLQLAERLGGTLLQAPHSVPIVIAERIARHGAPQVLVLAGEPAALEKALHATGRLQAQGLDLNLVALLDPGAGLPEALVVHRRRLGSLLCALDAGTTWPEDKFLLAKRLPGRIQAEAPVQLPPARLSPLERSQLEGHFPSWPKERLDRVFVQPAWEPSGSGWTARWWPGVDLPPQVGIVQPGIELQTASPLAEALRAALRAEQNWPVPILPLDGDPARLHALIRLCTDVQVFHGESPVWTRALQNLARLPAPMHFCARC
jgi:hypothetical protein